MNPKPGKETAPPTSSLSSRGCRKSVGLIALGKKNGVYKDD